MRFDWVAGTGGIGKGEIFRLIGIDTREVLAAAATKPQCGVDRLSGLL